MIDIEKVKKMLSEKKYDDICNIFCEEYKNIILEFSKNHDISLSDECTIQYAMNDIEKKYPELSGDIMVLKEILYSQGITIGDELNLMIEQYKNIKSSLS